MILTRMKRTAHHLDYNYPTLGNPTMPIFRLVPILPIRGGGPVASSFFFGGMPVGLENYKQ